MDTPTLDPKTFIRLTAESFEWRFLISKMIAAHKDDASELPSYMGVDKAGVPFYILPRAIYTAEIVARYTGLAPEVIAAKPEVKLRAPEKKPGIPEPTVDYWGEA